LPIDDIGNNCFGAESSASGYLATRKDTGC
jgi:hypothetical protein